MKALLVKTCEKPQIITWCNNPGSATVNYLGFTLHFDMDYKLKDLPPNRLIKVGEYYEYIGGTIIVTATDGNMDDEMLEYGMEVFSSYVLPEYGLLRR